MKYNYKSLKKEEQAWILLRSLYEQYGYKNYRMSKFEEYLFYAENIKFLESDRIITFTDLDGKLMALKPDVALSIVKNSKATATCPEKLCYMESVYRVSKQSNQFREISQIGLEYIGAVTDYTTTEVVKLALKSLEVIEKDYILNISHMGYIMGFLNSIEAEYSVKKKLLNCLKQKNMHELENVIVSAGIAQGAAKHLKALVAISGSLDQCIVMAKELAVNKTMQEAVNELEALAYALNDDPVLDKIVLDFSLVNDTDYYNGIIFQGFVKSVPRAILKGGRYDTLLEKMNKKDLQAIGFAIYFDGIDRYIKTANEYVVDTVILYDEHSDLSLLNKTVEQLVGEGQKVRAERNLPNEFAYNKVIKIDRDKISEVTVK